MARKNTNQPVPVPGESFVHLHTAMAAFIVQVVGGVALAVVIALDLPIGWKIAAAVGYIALGVVKAFALSNDRTIVEYKDIRR